MAIKLIHDISFEEEISLNNPIHSVQYVMDKYRESFNPELGHGFYEWEPITFANTEVVNKQAKYFKKYGIYTDIDPRSRHYKLFWDREEYRRKFGITVPIKVPPGGANSDKDLLPVWIPGPYYGHLNYGPIKRTVDPTEADVERALKNSIDVAEKLNKEKQIEELFKGLSNKEVAEKAYDFPDFWDGHFHFYLEDYVAGKLGLDLAVFKGRRKGFSYIGAWIAHNTYDLYPNSLTLLIAYDMKYLNKGNEALFNMVKNYSDFINQHTDWNKGRLIDNATNIKAGYIIPGVEGEHGSKSEVLCLSAIDNPNCARGKDAKKILYEESGSFPNLTETRTATKSAAETGGFVVGQSYYWGTVGKDANDMSGLIDIYHNPFAADCLPHKNVWTTMEDQKDEAVGLFFGQYQNLIGAIDKHGNSDFKKAKEIDDLQDKIKQKSEGYYKWRSERPRNPEEAMAPGTNNLFSKYHNKIKNQQVKLVTTHKDIARYGIYEQKGESVVFVSNLELKQKGLVYHEPITDMMKFLKKSTDKYGCIVEWATPHTEFIETKNGIVPHIPDDLYRAWHDPFATNKEDEEISLDNSFGVTYIYERPNNFTKTRGGRIVASWIGRPGTTDAYNEQLFLMLKRWNAKMLYENDRGVVYEYAVPRKLTKYLVEEPELLSMKEISGRTGRKYGISISKHAQRKTKGLILLHDFCGEQIAIDDFGGDVTFLDTFYCKVGLKEMLKFRAVGNFDCISTLIVGMYDIRESFDRELKTREENLEIDDFWARPHF